MCRILGIIFTSLLLTTTAPAQTTEVYFSPSGGCTAAIVNSLGNAKRTVLVQAYSFTSLPIATALLAAHKRGVSVRVLLDDSNQTDKYSAATFLKNAGLAPLIDAKHAISHNKIIIVDDSVVITGSFNFSKAAETSNAENLLVITDRVLAAKYTANWQQHAQHCSPYVKKAGTAKTSSKN